MSILFIRVHGYLIYKGMVTVGKNNCRYENEHYNNILLYLSDQSFI